jgi:hypothetical protein
VTELHGARDRPPPARRRPGLGAASAKGGEYARSDFAIPTGRRAISTIVLLKRKQTPARPRVPIASFSSSVSVRHTEWRHATGFVGPRKRKYRALERTNRTAHGIGALRCEDYTLNFRAFAASIVHPDVPNGRSRRTDPRMTSSSISAVAALTPSIQSVPRGAGACIGLVEHRTPRVPPVENVIGVACGAKSSGSGNGTFTGDER